MVRTLIAIDTNFLSHKPSEYDKKGKARRPSQSVFSRLQMLQKAYPEAMEDMPSSSSSSTFSTFLKKGTPANPNRNKSQRGGASSGSQKKDNWFTRWHGNDNASNNVSSDSEPSNTQSVSAM